MSLPAHRSYSSFHKSTDLVPEINKIGPSYLHEVQAVEGVAGQLGDGVTLEVKGTQSKARESALWYRLEHRE